MTRTNEEQLELFADLLEPAAEIIGDTEVGEVFQKGGKPIAAVKLAIKNHKAAVVEILARLDGVDPKEYEVPGPLTLSLKLFKLFSTPEVTELFTGQSQSVAASGGSATENIGDGAV